MTKISWTHNPATGGRGATWNPVTGCTKVSSGCHNCYAIPLSHRLAGMATTRDKYRGLTKAGGSNWTGVVRCHEDVLQEPLKVRQPTTFFVNSMSDTFHEDVPFEFIDKLFAVMALCPQHVFQCLSKRPERMAEYLNHPLRRRRIEQAARMLISGSSHGDIGKGFDRGMANLIGKGDTPLPGVWIGTSIENQAACVRIEDLLRCPAAVRFVSVEPMLERIDLTRWMGSISWLICGGESGPKARPFHLEWAYDLIDQCRSAGVPPFVKQIGSCARLQGEPYPRQHPDDRGKRADPRFWPKKLQIQEYPQR